MVALYRGARDIHHPPPGGQPWRWPKLFAERFLSDLTKKVRTLLGVIAACDYVFGAMSNIPAATLLETIREDDLCALCPCCGRRFFFWGFLIWRKPVTCR